MSGEYLEQKALQNFATCDVESLISRQTWISCGILLFLVCACYIVDIEWLCITPAVSNLSKIYWQTFQIPELSKITAEILYLSKYKQWEQEQGFNLMIDLGQIEQAQLHFRRQTRIALHWIQKDINLAVCMPHPSDSRNEEWNILTWLLTLCGALLYNSVMFLINKRKFWSLTVMAFSGKEI